MLSKTEEQTGARSRELDPAMSARSAIGYRAIGRLDFTVATNYPELAYPEPATVPDTIAAEAQSSDPTIAAAASRASNPVAHLMSQSVEIQNPGMN